MFSWKPKNKFFKVRVSESKALKVIFQMAKEKKDSIQETIYYGLAAVFVLWLLSTAYLVMQNNSLKATVEVNTISNDAELSSRLKSIESRLNVLETTSDYAAAEFYFYYDSTCEECNNTKWLAHLREQPVQGVDSVKTKLAKKNVAINIVDVSTVSAPAEVKRVPAFYVDVADFQANEALADYFRELGTYCDAYGNEAVVLVPSDDGQKSLLSQEESCAIKGSVKLDRYSPEECYLCDSADAGEETLKNALGEALDYSRYCIAGSEEQKNECIEAVGEEEYDAAMEEYARLQLPGSTMIPTYVLDCKHVFQAQNFAQLKEMVCNKHEELCGLLSLNATG